MRRRAIVDCLIQVVDDGAARTVRVAGRIEQVHVPDLLEACTSRDGPVRLDFGEVMSADAAALDALLRLRGNGVELVGVPTYMRLKLDSLS